MNRPRPPAERTGSWASITAEVQAVTLLHITVTCALQVDRKKLKSDKCYAPDWSAAASLAVDEEFAEPETELERQLQTVWQQVLSQGAISATSDFFRIGGTSLRVTRSPALPSMSASGQAHTDPC